MTCSVSFSSWPVQGRHQSQKPKKESKGRAMENRRKKYIIEVETEQLLRSTQRGAMCTSNRAIVRWNAGDAMITRMSFEEMKGFAGCRVTGSA